jgi:uncharacterized protein YndB with AHSA1/START domain
MVSVSRTVRVPAERIFDLLADPARHAEIDGSGHVLGVRAGSVPRLSLGARFGMDMRAGMSYRITNKVVEFEEGRLIAWRHLGRHRWRWELRPVDGEQTEVTETFDYSRAPAARFYEFKGIPESNRKDMIATLDRLEIVFGS